MNLLSRFYRAAFGAVLMLLHCRIFHTELFRNKRIAIVGAASSAYNTGKGDYIDGFDYVIRVNKAPLLLRDRKGKEDIGSKIDVLFHSFVENEFSGGGALDLKAYDELGIRYIVNPIPTFFGYRLIFNFYKKYLVRRMVFVLPRKFYDGIPLYFGRFRPTTGYCALKAALECEFSELYITGFTFFKTAYADGYRDPMKEAKQALQYIKDSNIHSPDLEYEGFKKMLEQHVAKRIVIDEVLQEILRQDSMFDFDKIISRKTAVNSTSK